MNGVFLVALCVSIFLEAIQRIVEPQEVLKPAFILVVGSLGLLSNIIGLLLFGHGHDHDHSHGEPAGRMEEGYGDIGICDESEPAIAVLPEHVIESLSRIPDEHHREHVRRAIHPANMRNGIIKAGKHVYDGDEPSEHTRLLGKQVENGYSSLAGQDNNNVHEEHNHTKPKDQDAHGSGHGHGHGHDLNMRGVFLHVMGDALGNIGVIISALIIWKTSYSWRYYSDPAISLIITCIILGSALPLCKAASRILLQAVPAGLSIDHIVEDINSLPGVISCHHLHVWQLSDTKLVSSLHIKVDCDIKGEGSDRYMELARQVRECLHDYGIHSSTIQPEFHADSSTCGSDADGDDTVVGPGSGTGTGKGKGSASGSVRCSSACEAENGESCLLNCSKDCADNSQCCPPR